MVGSRTGKWEPRPKPTVNLPEPGVLHPAEVEELERQKQSEPKVAPPAPKVPSSNN